MDETTWTISGPAYAQTAVPTPLVTVLHASASDPRPCVARLVIAGVGGGGSNAVNRMIAAGIHGVEFVAINTDAQALTLSRAQTRLHIGALTTRGLGAGGNPAIGAKAAEESYATLCQTFAGADLVFITAGMGGGTGTGASSYAAQAAREQGALAIAIVTTPFGFERRRKGVADQGIQALRRVVDALIVVPNERLTQLAGNETGAFEAYRIADDVLRMGVQGISDLITIPGLINLDFADLRAVLCDAGSAYMAMSQASGDDRAEEVARAALTNPLLEMSVRGARGMIFNITGGDDLTMHEVSRIAELLGQAAHPDANLIFGTVYDPDAAGTLKLTIVATGFEVPIRSEDGGEPWVSARVAPATPHLEMPPAQVPQVQALPQGSHPTEWSAEHEPSVWSDISQPPQAQLAAGERFAPGAIARHPTQQLIARAEAGVPAVSGGAPAPTPRTTRLSAPLGAYDDLGDLDDDLDDELADTAGAAPSTLLRRFFARR